VKQGMVVFAAVAAFALTAPAATAEPLRFAQSFGPDVLPPYEIVTIIRSAGLDPLSRPFLRGPNYVMRAFDHDYQEVRVVVDARRGDIIRIVPVAVASRMPPRGGVTMGPYERMDGQDADDYDAPPPRYGASEEHARYGAPPPVVLEDDPMDGDAPRPPASVPGVPSAGAMPPPVIRQSPSYGASVQPMPGSRMAPPAAPLRRAELPPLSEPHVITADPSRAGALPPPPERSLSRTAEPAKSKPVKRNVASIPKQTPLPKPRPPAAAHPDASTASNATAPLPSTSGAGTPASAAPAAVQPPASGGATQAPAAKAPAPVENKAPAPALHPADAVPN